MTFRITRFLIASVMTLVFFFQAVPEMQATHFRYGTITWTVPDPVGAPNTVQIVVKQAWRRSFYGSPNIGSVVSTGSLVFGGGSPSSSSINLLVTSVNTTEDWIFGEATFTHTYPGAGAYTAYFSSCCRVSTLLDGNADGNFRVETLINLNYPSNESPNISLPAIVNVPINSTDFTLNLAALTFDPEGDPVTFRFATTAESGLTNNPPSLGGMYIDGSGVLHWNTTSGFSVNQLRSVSIVAEDRAGSPAGPVKSKVFVDLILRIVNTSLPPFFIYPPTPGNGALFTVSPGTNVSFVVQGDDPDPSAPNGTVTLNVAGLPSGATMSPTLPLLGASGGLGVVSSTFSWTPTLAQVGSYNISFILQDGIGVQTITNVTIVVSTSPVFDVGPTPGNMSYYCREAGEMLAYRVQASDADPADLINLSAGVVPPPPTAGPPSVPGGLAFVNALSPNLMFTPTLPTATAANPVFTDLNWNIAASDFGIHIIQFTATDQGGKTSTLSHYVIVDRDPSFTSTPLTTATVGVPYVYNITATDPDIPLGDAVAFAPGTFPYVTIPGWLTLTDNGNGTATLSGTPTLADVGSHPVQLELHDRTTHFQHIHCSWQFQNFSIMVSSCTDPLPGTVEGCGIPILDMDNTPDPGDYTDFGSALVDGGMVSRTYRIENPGPNPMTFTGPLPVSISPTGEFSVTSQPAALVAPGGETSFTIKFDPSTVGTHTATVSLVNDICTTNPHTFAIKGYGAVEPSIFLSGNSQYINNRAVSVSATDDTDFGNISVGGMVTHTFSIENILNGLDLNLDGLPLVSVAGQHASDFIVTQPSLGSVSGGGNTTFQVKFSPSATGARKAQVVITHNDLPDNPFVFTIEGQGL